MNQASDDSRGNLRALRIAHVAVVILSALLAAFAFHATRGNADTSDNSPLLVILVVNGGLAAFMLLVAVPLIHVGLLRRRPDAQAKQASERFALGLGAIWFLCLFVTMLGTVSAMLWQRFVVFVPFSACALAYLLFYRPSSRA